MEKQNKPQRAHETNMSNWYLCEVESRTKDVLKESFYPRPQFLFKCEERK